MEALGTLGCECRIEPQHQARSLQWNVVRPDPAPSNVPLEAKAENEQEQLLLLEPQEFLQGAAQLTQITDPPCSIPWLSPKSLTRSHLAVIGLDAYLWYHLTSVGLAWVGFQESGLPLVALSQLTPLGLSWLCRGRRLWSPKDHPLCSGLTSSVLRRHGN